MNKVRAKVLFVLLVAVACLASGQTAYSQDYASWQRDWLKFGEAIAPYAREGVVERKGNVFEFNRVFGKKVEWKGKLRKFHSNELAKFLELEMEPIQIQLQNGGVIEASELSIRCSVKDSGCEGWSEELVGKEVIFRTELRNRTRGLLPVVRVMEISRENRRIEIETHTAELVKVVSD